MVTFSILIKKKPLKDLCQNIDSFMCRESDIVKPPELFERDGEIFHLHLEHQCGNWTTY